jgi:hypothetical protein
MVDRPARPAGSEPTVRARLGKQAADAQLPLILGRHDLVCF